MVSRDIYLKTGETPVQNIKLVAWGPLGVIHHYIKTFTEHIGILDTSSRTVNLIRILTDSIGNLDSKIKCRIRTFIEKIGMVDTKLISKSLHRIFSESLGLKDSITRIRSIFRVFIEKVGIRDRMLHLKNWFIKRFKERPRQDIRGE